MAFGVTAVQLLSRVRHDCRPRRSRAAAPLCAAFTHRLIRPAGCGLVRSASRGGLRRSSSSHSTAVGCTRQRRLPPPASTGGPVPAVTERAPTMTLPGVAAASGLSSTCHRSPCPPGLSAAPVPRVVPRCTAISTRLIRPAGCGGVVGYTRRRGRPSPASTGGPVPAVTERAPTMTLPGASAATGLSDFCHWCLCQPGLSDALVPCVAALHCHLH